MTLNEAILSIGSNIQPRENIEKCMRLLREHTEVKKISGVWKTRAIGSEGPEFFNASIQIFTQLTVEKRVTGRNITCPRDLGLGKNLTTGLKQRSRVWGEECR